MSYFNELVITVGEMIDRGLSDRDIAELNHITLDMVREIQVEWYPHQAETCDDSIEVEILADQHFLLECENYDNAASFADCE
jgi:hypothetical protein